MRSETRRYAKANPVPMEGLIRPAIARTGHGSEIMLDILGKNWAAIVGEANARNTGPSAFQDGMLTIVVPSPVWMTQARFMKKSFLDTINRFLSLRGMNIRDITFAPAPRKQE